jgi:STAM-binding protein
LLVPFCSRDTQSSLFQAQIYEREGNDQQAYLLLMRFMTLVVENLPEHPQSRNPEDRKSLKLAMKALPDVLERLELLKPRIEARYESYQEALARRRESAATYVDGQPGRSNRPDPAESDPAIAGRPTLAAAEHSDFAVRLAKKEIRRRDDVRRGQAGRSERRDQIREEYESRNQLLDDDDFQRRMEDTRRRMDDPRDSMDAARLTDRAPAIQVKSSEYRYPFISKSQPVRYVERPFEVQKPLERNDLPPPVPAKASVLKSYPEPTPPRPDKIMPPTPTASPMQDASAYTFRPSAYLESGEPLRTIFLPPNLRDRFLQIAAFNTRNNLETCGFLCGTLISNAWFISRLVIPEQESTSDTCEMINESALFDYCDSEDLIVLGWIHTHPTQTCFMSSRDLHTHAGYQVMLAESIAIVCAPSASPS